MLKFIVMVALVSANAMLNAYVLWSLYLWFIVPIGAQPIGYWHAFGLGLFGTWLSAMMYRYHSDEKAGTYAEAVSGVITVSIAMVFIQAVAWAVHFLM